MNGRTQRVKQKILFSHYRMGLSVGLVLLMLLMGLFGTLVYVHAEKAAVVPNTIFSDMTTATIQITTTTAMGSLSYTVNDLDGAIVGSGTLGVKSRQVDLTMPKLPDGYYMLTVVDHTVSSNPQQKISFAIVPPSAQGDGRFGLGVHFDGNEAGLAPLMSELGTGVVRSDVTWSQIEQAQQQYSFAGYDGSLQVLQENNQQPLLILDYNNRFYDNGQTPYDDAGLKAFANYAQAVVMHYGAQLKAVEIYNEYNGLFSNGPCARKASCYARMLQYSYEAIKAVRPDVTVVGGAVYGVDLVWFQQLFQAGGLRYMDVLSDHAYVPGNLLSPEQTGMKAELEMLQGLMRLYNYGVAKPLWITEMGWPTTLLGVNERMQAQYLVRGAVLGLAAGVQRFFWYDFVNDGNNIYMPEQNFGLLRLPDAAGRYTPKPAFVAYLTLIRELAGQKFVGGREIGIGVYDEYFGNMHVLWATNGGKVLLRTSNPVTMTTMVGKKAIYTPMLGWVTLNLSGDPIYVSAGGISQVISI
jgi:Glycosyl hydrolase catalytic core